MASSRAKFTLKPSSLSQHTANFNKILEQVPVPKIDSLNIVKPLDKKILTTDHDTNSISQLATQQQKENEIESNQNNAINKDTTTTSSTSSSSSSSSSSSTTTTATTTTTTKTETTSNESTKSSLDGATNGTKSSERIVSQFVFGEQLNDRVINAAVTNGNNNENGTDENSDATATTATTNASIWPAVDATAAADDKYDDNDSNTIVKFNCKLFLLDSDKINWSERGYGLFKLIESNDAKTCKMMMWTDKTYRLILNTKIFDKMQIDRANKKSIRFNAFDNGTIRIFLIKTANQNDCDEMFDLLEHRLNLIKENTSFTESTSEKHASSSNYDLSLRENLKKIIFTCHCDLTRVKQSSNANVSKDTNDDDDDDDDFENDEEDGERQEQPQSFKDCKLQLYTYRGEQDQSNSSKRRYENHQLLMDIVGTSANDVSMTTYLKFIRMTSKRHEFEFDEAMIIKSSTSNQVGTKKSSSLYRVLISDKESWDALVALYDKEPKFRRADDDDDDDEDEEDDNNDDDDDNSSSANAASSSSNESDQSVGGEEEEEDSNQLTREAKRRKRGANDESGSSSPVNNSDLQANCNKRRNKSHNNEEVDEEEEECESNTATSDSTTAIASAVKRDIDESSSNELEIKKPKVDETNQN